MQILRIDSSTTGAESVPRALTGMIMDRLGAKHPDARVVVRDLGSEPIAHLNPITTGAIRKAREEQTPDMQAAAPAERAILDEFLASDIVVVGAPMYNFSIPSGLKAWIDRLGMPRVTFRYGPSGAEGLAGGRRIIIASARGGVYQPGGPAEHQESLLTSFFQFIGCDDITIIRAEGIGGGQREAQLAAAKEQIAHL